MDWTPGVEDATPCSAPIDDEAFTSLFYGQGDGLELGSLFQQFRHFIAERTGIHFTVHQRPLLARKVGRRLWATGILDAATYLRSIRSGGAAADELSNLVHEVSVHLTDFFRHPRQLERFSSLVERFAGRDLSLRQSGLRVWSAGCSTGEEAYTLAMLLRNVLRGRRGFTVLATDISEFCIEQAHSGNYEQSQLKTVPEPFRSECFVRVPSLPGQLSVAPEIRQHVTFLVRNLVEDSPCKLTIDMDIIYCANVLSYFHFATRKLVLNRLLSHLKPDGFLLLGPCDAIRGLGDAFPRTALSSRILSQLCPSDILFPIPE